MLIEVKNGEMFEITINLKDDLKKETGLTYKELNHELKKIKAFIERKPSDSRPTNTSMKMFITKWLKHNTILITT